VYLVVGAETFSIAYHMIFYFDSGLLQIAIIKIQSTKKVLKVTVQSRQL